MNMRRFFWIIIAVIAITGCGGNKNSAFEKFLFFMDMAEGVSNYPYYHFVEPGTKPKYYNIDSIHALFARIDTNEYKPSENEGTFERMVLYYKDEWLDSICTEEQLIQLVNDKKHSAATRITAFVSLISRGYGGLEKMILDNYQDTARLTVTESDYGWTEHAGSMFLRYGDIARKRGLITAQDSARNFSIAFFNPNLPVYFYILNKLDTMRPQNERYHDRIRRLYCQEQHEATLKALTRYHKEEDKELIASELNNAMQESSFWNISCALSAVAEWPDPYFKAPLAELRDRIVAFTTQYASSGDMAVNERFLKAVFAYDYSWAHKFIEETLRAESKVQKGKHQELIVDKLHSWYFREYYPQYNDLRKKYPSKRYSDN